MVPSRATRKRRCELGVSSIRRSKYTPELWGLTVPKVMGNDTIDWHMRKSGCLNYFPLGESSSEMSNPFRGLPRPSCGVCERSDQGG